MRTVKLRNAYALLGVRQDATLDEVKAGYRATLKRVHPDKSGVDPKVANALTADVVRAFEIVGEPEARRVYDSWLRWIAGASTKIVPSCYNFDSYRPTTEVEMRRSGWTEV